MKLDASGRPRPHLAQSVSRPAPLTYVYTLRKRIRFWNGNELTATDVANALNYYRFKGFASSAQLGYPSVREIRATGRYEVVVKLKRRDPLWQYTPAAFGWIFEKKFADEHKERMGRPGVLTMGTGPWRFDSLDPTRGLELSANPNYWGGRVPIQRVSIRHIPDPTAQALALRAGEIDFVPTIGGDPRAFASASGMPVRTYETCGLWFLAMNVKKPPWNDVHVRRAAAYALNKRDIITAQSGGTGSPLPTLIGPATLRTLGSKPEVDKLLKSVPQYPFNLAKARAEMAQSRYRNDARTTIPIISLWRNGAQAIAAMLDRVGIKAEVKVVTVPEIVAVLLGPRENIDTLYSPFACVSSDPGFLAQAFVHSKSAVNGKFNFANYTSAAADAQIDAGKKLADPAERLAAYGRLLQIMGRDVPYVPIQTNDFAYALSQDFTFAGLNQFTYNSSGWLLGLKRR